MYKLIFYCNLETICESLAQFVSRFIVYNSIKVALSCKMTVFLQPQCCNQCRAIGDRYVSYGGPDSAKLNVLTGSCKEASQSKIDILDRNVCPFGS